MLIGYHASHEQFSPQDLCVYAQMAEQNGFGGIMSSDHIAPWSRRQGESGAAWPWLGAALQSTTAVPFGALAIPGGWRYHPVIVAHAFATLAQMFPQRMRWIAAGSGEWLNEHMVGKPWPNAQERHARLVKGVEMIRRLWRGESVTETDPPLQADSARLWTLPEKPPAIYAAVLSEESAAAAGRWADGIITVRKSVAELRAIRKAFYTNGGAGKPVVLQLQLCWAQHKAEALRMAHDQWSHIALPGEKFAHLKEPEDIDAAAARVTVADVEKALFISDDPADHLDFIRVHAALGFDEIYLHNAAGNQPAFITRFGKDVLPKL